MMALCDVCMRQSAAACYYCVQQSIFRLSYVRTASQIIQIELSTCPTRFMLGYVSCAATGLCEGPKCCPQR